MRFALRASVFLTVISISSLTWAQTRHEAVRIVPGAKADETELRYVQLLKDRITELSRAGVSVGPVPGNFQGLVIQIGTIKSHPELETLAKKWSVAVPTDFDPGVEGYIVATKPDNLQQTVLAIGTDRRGVLYAVGELLRQMEGRGTKVEFPDTLQVRHAPRWPVRGLLVSQGATICELTGAREWTRDENRRAFLNYALAGANTFELGANGGPDNLFDFLKSYDLDLLVCVVANQGTGPDEWQAKEGIGRKGYLSPGIPEARAALIKQHTERFPKLKQFDYMHLKSGDGGGDESEASAPYGRALIHLCEELAPILKKSHPKIKIFVGNQKLDNAGDQAIFDYLQAEKREWLDGIIYGPGSNAMGWTPGRRQDHRTDLFRYAGRGAMGGYLREMLHQLPPRQSILLFTDITHWVYSQYGLMDHEMIPDRNYQTPPKWDYEMYAHKPDPAMRQVYNRRTFHARPTAYYNAFQETAAFTIGDVAYSEGHFDHTNAWTYQRLFWHPHQSVNDVVAEFSRAHFGRDAAPAMTEAIFTLEKNVETPIADNPGIDRMITLVKQAGEAMPDDLKARNYLWRQFLEKAYLDKYIQLDVRQQNAAVEKITTELKTAFHDGNLDATVAKLAKISLPEPSAQMLECKTIANQVGTESDKIYGVRSDGYFNLKQDYVGFGWLHRSLEQAAAAAPDKRKALVERILYNDDPGVGGYYDDAGDVTRSPHLTHGWPYDGGEVSTENRHSQQTMAYTTSEKEGVTFQYDDLDPKAEYRVRLSLVRPKYKPRYAARHKQTRESILADDVVIAKELELPESNAADFEFDIPKEATADGKLTLSLRKQEGVGEGLQSDLTIWRNTGGWGTLVSEVWLMKKGQPKQYETKAK